jgi:spermidine synthase
LSKPIESRITSWKQPTGKQTGAFANQRLKHLVLLAFCLSGFAGLMHQVVWAKLLASLIGTTAHAQAVVLAVFMGGLALGSVLFGRRVDRRGSPLRTYVVLEVLIAVYCLILPLLLMVTESGYVVLAGYFFESTTFTFSLRFGLAFLLVLFPAVLMGGTLPVLARQLIASAEQTQKYVASLYSLNSFGAVLGAATAGFLTLPLFGVYASLVMASLLNLAAAALLFKPARSEISSTVTEGTSDSQQPEKTARPDSPLYGPVQYRATLVALALSGFAALGYEVLFTRVIALAFGSSAYSFTVMLMSFILGISLGSAIISRIRVERPLWMFGISQLLVVVALLAITPFIARLPYLTGLLRIELKDLQFGFELYQLGKVGLCLVFLLLPTIMLGFGFPLVAQIQARRSPDIGYRVGSTYAWNTVGNVLGAVLTSLVLLPALGLLGAFHFNFTLNLVAGLIVLYAASETRVSRKLVASSITMLVVVAYLTTGTAWLDPINFAPNHLRLYSGPDASASTAEQASHPASSFDAWKRRYIIDPDKLKAIYFEEDEQTTVHAINYGSQIVLFVNGKPDASTGGDLSTQLFLAHLPMFLAPEARRALVIGYGSGITSGSVMRHPLEDTDIAEISSGVLNADQLFSEFNYAVLDDPRVSIHRDDGLSFLRSVPYRYDLIISEPSNPWIAGISGLFTREFFKEMSDKLNPGGLAVVWFHTYEQSDEGVQMVMRTIGSVFPHAIVGRSPNYSDIIVIASNDPIEPDFEAMEERFDEPAIRNDLARIGISSLASLLAHFALTPERFHEVLPPGPVNTVSRQRLEYSAPRTYFYQETSSFLKQVDSLTSGTVGWDSTILGRYLRYRAAAGEPVRYKELEYLINRSHKVVAAALKNLPLLSETLAGPPTRSARGMRPAPGTAGFYEAVFWADHFQREGRGDLASLYLQRYQALVKTTGKN